MSSRRKSKPTGPRPLVPVVVCTGKGTHPEQVLGLMCSPDLAKVAKYMKLGTTKLHQLDEGEDLDQLEDWLVARIIRQSGVPDDNQVPKAPQIERRWAIEWRCPVPGCDVNVRLREEQLHREVEMYRETFRRRDGKTPRIRVDLSTRRAILS